jgi:glycosyltransferase involved in cell wall biosynthesis
MPKVYHLLPEAEAFSEFDGGAISRWVANVLRDDEAGIVAACGSDTSWGFDPMRILTLPALNSYHRWQERSRRRMPWMLRKFLLKRVFKPLTSRLKPGDVVWVHNRPEFAAALGQTIHHARARLVLHMHNSHLLTAGPKVVRELQLDSSVFVSLYLKQETCEKFPEFRGATVLYNGADDGIFFPVNEEPRDKIRPVTVIFASRVVPEKGPAVLAEALRCLFVRGVPVEGLIVGGAQFGSSEPTEFVRELLRNAPRNLRFHPYCVGKQLADLLRESDIFCMPSTWQEPLSMATLEAMATGLAVVATRSGGIPETLLYGGGLLVERGSVAELASAIERLVLDPMLRRKLAGEAFRSFVGHFRWPTVVENYQAIVDRIIRQAPKCVNRA